MSFVPRNRFARYTRRVPGERNRTEAAYEAHLQALCAAGEICGFEFEGMKLRMADKTWWTPDFVVMTADGYIELHDTKGTTTKTRANGEKEKAPWIEDDARVKMKVIAEQWPFKVFAVFKTPAGWVRQAF